MLNCTFGHRSLISCKNCCLFLGDTRTEPFLWWISSLSIEDAGALRGMRVGLTDLISERITVHRNGPLLMIILSSRNQYPVPKNIQPIRMLVPANTYESTDGKFSIVEKINLIIAATIIMVSHQSYFERKYIREPPVRLILFTIIIQSH